MNELLFAACGLVALTTIAVVVLVVVLDWADAPRRERLALSGIAAGMIWAAPSRFAAGGLGPGDLVLLVGILALVLLTYGRRLVRHADLIDGREDRRVGPLQLLVGWAGPEAIEAELRRQKRPRR